MQPNSLLNHWTMFGPSTYKITMKSTVQYAAILALNTAYNYSGIALN